MHGEFGWTGELVTARIRAMPPTVPELFNSVLNRVEAALGSFESKAHPGGLKEHGRWLSDALAFLAAAQKDGLYEHELLQLLGKCSTLCCLRVGALPPA